MQIEVRHTHVHQFEDRVIRSLLASLSTLAEAYTSISQQMEKIMSLADDLQAKAQATLDAVRQEQTVDASILKLVTDQKSTIQDLNQKLQDAISSNDPQKLQAVADALDQASQLATLNAKTVSDAVTANTQASGSGSGGSASGQGSAGTGTSGSTGSTGTVGDNSGAGGAQGSQSGS